MTTTPAPETPTIEETAAVASRVLDEVGKAIVGKQESLRLVLCAILAKGHVLLEDYPGLGKTLAARSFARALGLDFARAQFTPDLLPSDLTGSFLYNQRTSDFEFRRGPLFTGLLLADEINRTPPKTQSALLEAMQERQVTVEGETFPLPEPFHVLATANPIEYEGTYPLPEAQLDRFLLRVSFGYPSAGRGVRRHRAPRRSAARRRSSSRRSPTRPGCAACRPPSRRSGSTRASAATASRSPRPPATTATPSPAPRPAARSAWSSPRARSRCCAAATTSSPRTSRPSPAPCSRTASRSGPSSG